MSSLTSPIHAFWRNLLQCSRLLIDLVTDVVFQWLMVGFIKPRNKLPRTWRLLPPVNNNVLMQSATSLARKIRLKEVSIIHDSFNINSKYFVMKKWYKNSCCIITYQNCEMIVVNFVSIFQITSEEIVRSCIDRINEINPVLNAVVDERYMVK